MSALDLRPKAQFRPTDWRWMKAKLMRDDPRTASLLRAEDDEYTRKAKQFQIEFEGCRDDYDKLLLERKWPDLIAARYCEFGPNPQLTKWETQARLLANEPFERIAERMTCTVASVIWYEKLFFNVLDRLNSKGYIAHRVIGESLQAGLTERDYQCIWQMYGYMGGSVVLDAMIDRNFNVTQPEKSDQMREFSGDDVQNSMLIKSMISARTMPINSYTQQIILEIHQRFIELKKQSDGPGSGDMGSANVLVMLQTLPWTIGDQRVLVASDDPKRIVGRLSDEIIRADETAVELRSDDLLQLSVGQTPARPRSPLTAQFPPEEKRDVAVAD